MATKKKITVEETATKTETQAEKKPETVQTEFKYPVNALIEGYKAFGVNKEIAIVALKLDGKAAYSRSEAEKIINKFKNKEVSK